MSSLSGSAAPFWYRWAIPGFFPGGRPALLQPSVVPRPRHTPLASPIQARPASICGQYSGALQHEIFSK